jgi:hypothetical protein
MTDLYPRHAFNVAPGEPQLSVAGLVARFFRRAIAAVRRKEAVPAVAAAGAATPPDGLRVLGDRMLSEVRREHDALTDAEIAALRPRKRLARHDGEVLIDERNRVTVRPVNGRSLGTLPRRRPGATLPYVEPLVERPGKQPWHTTQMPVYGEKPQLEVDKLYRNGWQ